MMFGRLHVQNPTAFRRRATVRCPVPLDKGALPFGAVSRGLVICEETGQPVGLWHGTAQSIPWEAWAPWSTSRSSMVVAELGAVRPAWSGSYRLDVLKEHLPAMSFDPEVARVVAYREFELEATLVSKSGDLRTVTLAVSNAPIVLENAQARQVLRGRFPAELSGYVAELTAVHSPGTPVSEWQVRIVWSDPRVEAIVDIDPPTTLEITVRGALGFVDYEQQLGSETVHATAEALWSSISVPVKATQWGDGQGPIVTGRAVFLDHARPDWATLQAESVAPLLVVADGVEFGRFPRTVRPEYLTETGAADAAHRLVGKVASRMPRNAGLWGHAVHQAAERPGVSGDQADFVLSPLVELEHTVEALPLLYAVRYAARQEACRPIAFREVDGSTVRAEAHPLNWTWMHRTHYHKSYGADRLGKPAGQSERYATSDRTAMWRGWDPSHESIEHLCAAVIATGDRAARDVLEDWVETWLRGFPAPGTPAPALEGIGAPRAHARSMQAALSAWLCTGRVELAERIRDRWELNYAQQATTPIGPISVGGVIAVDAELHDVVVPDRECELVRLVGVSASVAASEAPIDYPLHVSSLFKADARAVPEASWSPWQEAFVAASAAATYRALGLPICRTIAERAACTVVAHGIRPLADGSFELGGYLAWQSGSPLSDSDWDRSDKVKPYSQAVADWILPAVHLALAFRTGRSDQASRSIVDRCHRYLDWIGSLDVASDGRAALEIAGGWSRFSAWMSCEGLAWGSEALEVEAPGAIDRTIDAV